MRLQQNYIVFQCYGYERVFHECAFALLSLSRLYGNRFPANTQVWIYTDKPEWFSTFKDCPLPLHFRQMDNTTIKLWRGSINFVHRVKIEILKDFTKEKNGNILYADTDVVFIHSIDELFSAIEQGRRYMHIMEGKVCDEGNPIFRKLNEYLKANPDLKLNGKPLNEVPMWNAGVLGFNTADKNRLDNVLTFTDTHYRKFPKHIVEQFAFSVYFSEPGDIKTAAPHMIHYWNLKEAGVILGSFFDYFKNSSWKELVQYSTLVQIPALMQEKINFYQGRSLMDKVKKKVWAPGNVDWADMIKQL